MVVIPRGDPFAGRRGGFCGVCPDHHRVGNVERATEGDLVPLPVQWRKSEGQIEGAGGPPREEKDRLAIADQEGTFLTLEIIPLRLAQGPILVQGLHQ